MSPTRRREAQSRGGQTTQAKGLAPLWNSEQAKAAAKKSVEIGTCHRFTPDEARAARAIRSGGVRSGSTQRIRVERARRYSRFPLIEAEQRRLRALGIIC